MQFVEPPSRKAKRPVISAIFSFLYLLIFLFALSLPFLYQNLPFISYLGLTKTLVLVPAAVLAAYAFLIAFSFFLRGDNWLLLSIVILFFSTLGAVFLLVLGIMTGKNLPNGIPSCVNDISLCNSTDGFTLLSALLLGISIPTLVLNLLTFIAAYKTMGTK
ncbi:MAG: hypothetical protein Q8P13_03985 [bacterium]|nr:hypothetical protein [bacterium]